MAYLHLYILRMFTVDIHNITAFKTVWKATHVSVFRKLKRVRPLIGVSGRGKDEMDSYHFTGYFP